MGSFEELIKNVESLGLPKSDFAIFGSAHLHHCNLRDFIGDIDIIARGDAWKKAVTLGKIKNAKSGVGQVVEFFNGDVEVFNDWPYGPWDINALINTAKEINGLRYVTLENILKWKNIRNSEKDLLDIKKIKKYLLNKVK